MYVHVGLLSHRFLLAHLFHPPRLTHIALLDLQRHTRVEPHRCVDRERKLFRLPSGYDGDATFRPLIRA